MKRNLGVSMSGDHSVVRRGRPLGMVSIKVLEKVTSETRLTSSQLSTALQLNRRHAANVCSELAAAGHLQVVAREGRNNVYSKPQSEEGEPTWLFIGRALRP